MSTVTTLTGRARYAETSATESGDWHMRMIAACSGCIPGLGPDLAMISVTRSRVLVVNGPLRPFVMT
ncbi:hypothetical protein Sxan_13700 [Streptomyces xanthophaeus]|uniref:Uncharacterized protein n=1 Tax=Streptomyces xanthophaeus TaxID=67385 RepID=A0A919LBR0_9ACTN|nr:hypothetical protein Sxan_13700 [Streptomyces xanthophaeus]